MFRRNMTKVLRMVLGLIDATDHSCNKDSVHGSVRESNDSGTLKP